MASSELTPAEFTAFLKTVLTLSAVHSKTTKTVGVFFKHGFRLLVAPAQ